MDDTLELREQLSDAWRSALAGMIARGSPTQAAVETMAAVAHERFAELFGLSAAANYLQLLAEQLRDVDHIEAELLVRGDEQGARPKGAGPSVEPDWGDRSGSRGW